MATMVGVLIFVGAIVVSIALHEVGHMVPAKLFGVKVPEYAVGFGPKLWSTRRGETVYAINAVPLGGYVKLSGMYPPARPGANPDALIERVRHLSRADLAPGEEGRAFSALPPWKKLIIMVAGPAANLAISATLITVLLTMLGTPAVTTTVHAISDCAPTTVGTECGPGDTPAPAAAAGFEPGDTITEWGGVPVTTWGELVTELRTSPAEPVAVTVTRDGETVTVTVTPTIVEQVILGDDGLPTGDGTETSPVPFVGITPAIDLVPQPVSTVPATLWGMTSQTFTILAALPELLWDTTTALIVGDDRPDGSVMSVVGAGQVAGDITSSGYDQYGAKERTADMVALIASINMALFAFNLIPFPPLDGGYVVAAVTEQVRNTVARIRHQPVPRPVDIAKALPLAWAGVAALTVMSIILIWADIAHPVA